MMTRSQTGGQILHNLIRGGTCSLLVGAVLLTALLIPGIAAAQTKSKKSADSEKVLGKIASVEKKGKTAKLSVTKDDGGDTLEISILPKTVFAVVAPGDTSFLVPNQYISGKALKNNDRLLLDALTVYVGIKPEFKCVPDPDSASEYDVCGIITAVDKDFTTVDFGGTVGAVQVVIPATARVTVNAADAALAPEGAPVVLEGTTRSGKFLPAKVTVTLETPLKAEDVLDKSKTASKSKTAAAKTAKTKTTKSKDDAPTEGGEATTADPFGLIKKKDTKGKSKTTDKAADKTDSKDAEKKDADKPSDKKPATSSKDAAKPAGTADAKP